MSLIQSVTTSLNWFSTIQFSPSEGVPVLVAVLADDGLAVGFAQICPNDGRWRSVPDNERLDPDDIEMWAEVALPPFNN